MSKLDNKPLVWLWTHCSAIGMDCKSESGELEHDIALFTIKQQERIAELERKLFDAEKAMPCKFDKDGHTYYADDKTIARMIDTERELAAAQATIQQMRDNFLTLARMAEYLKRDCGMDPESPQAIRNAQYMNLSYFARRNLAIPADRTALDAMLAEARKEQAEKDARICDTHTIDDVLVGVGIAQSCATIIRQAAERGE